MTWRDSFLRFHERAGFSGEMRFDEPMAAHTTFRVGGGADLWIRPLGDCFIDYTQRLLGFAREQGIPLFILGGGANIVVASRGIRGIVIDLGAFNRIEFIAKGSPGELTDTKVIQRAPGVPKTAASPLDLLREGKLEVQAQAGALLDTLAEEAAEQGFGGLEFLAGMPGTVGGALWMNARSGEQSMSDGLLEAEFIDRDLNRRLLRPAPGDFSYKKSPFQGRGDLILQGRFRGYPREPGEIREANASLRRDREAKGHYRAPSAGSAFKNNRDFGKPTGKIIDELGLRGFSLGGAAVAPWHGNFIINQGGATAEDVRNLTRLVEQKVYDALGINLEREILFVGDWED